MRQTIQITSTMSGRQRVRPDIPSERASVALPLCSGPSGVLICIYIYIYICIKRVSYVSRADLSSPGSADIRRNAATFWLVTWRPGAVLPNTWRLLGSLGHTHIYIYI